MLLLLASPIQAQSIVDAHRVEFTPSADNNTLGSDGTPLVSGYTLTIYLAGAPSAYATANLGKPTPDTDGMMRVDFSTLLSTPLQVGVIYESTVSAVGPGGSAESTRSNTFELTTACTSTLSAASQNIGSGAATGSVGVTAGCAWIAIANDSWLTVTSGASGTGNGTVGFSAAANTVTTARTGTLTIAGNTFSVNQAAAPCTYTLASTSQSEPAAGGTGSVGVTALAGCAWTATSNNTSWLTVTSGSSGSGNGTVGFSAAANTTTSARSGTLTIGGNTFTVNEAAQSCTYTLSTSSQSEPAAGGTGSVGVTALAGCAWTATSNNTSWLTITSGASGSGNGTVGFSAAANTTTSPLSGTLTIGGNTFTVNEAAQSCTYTLSTTSQAEPAAGGTGSVGVTALAGCAWTATSNNVSWLTVTSGTPGSGNGTVGFSATANTSTSARSGTLTIGGNTFTVNEAAQSCTYTLASTSQAEPAAGGTGSVGVTAPAGCAWTATSNNTSWLTVTSGASGSGNGTVGFSAAANTTTSPLSGTLTIGGNTFTVTEAAQACTYTLSTSSQSEPAAGGTGSVGVTALAGCAWTATSNNTSWLTVTSGASGSGNGTVGFSAAANTTTSPITGTLTIGGNTFTVTEAAQSCTYTLSTTSQAEPAAGGSGSVGVTALAGCAWTATSNNTSWLTVTSGASGSGNGTVGFSAAANTTTSPLSGTLTIGGNTFTVTEAAQSCTYTLSTSSQSEPAAGGTGSVGVTALAGCAWTATSNNTSWLTVTSGASGSGNGTVGFSAAANTTTSPLSGTLTIGGNTFTVTEAAQSCTYTLSTSSQSEPAAGGTGSVGVTALAGCAWTATSNNVSWLTVTSGTPGSGNGTVGFSATANTSTSARSGTLTIGGNTFTVTEAAQPCTYTLSTTSQSEPAAGGTGSVGVTALAGCAWTATSNNTSWLTVTSGASGSGNGTVGFSAAANTTTSPLSGTLTIGGNTFTVTEAAQPCTYTLSTSSQSEPAAGGSGSVGVTALAGCAWTATSNNTSWLTITSGASGSGNGTVGFAAAANTTTSPISGTLTIGGNTFTVTEAAQPCTYTLSTTSQSEPAAGGTGSVGVTALAGCAWTATSSNTSWLTVTSGASGSGNGTVGFSAAANTTTSPISGTLTIGGNTFTVNEAALSCTYTLSTTSQSEPASGGTGSVGVTAPGGCAWTASSNNTSWLTVTSGTSGSGNGTVFFSAAANTSTSPLSGTLTIGGNTFTVNEAALSCTYTLSTSSQSEPAAGGTGSVGVTAPAGCAWTATSNNTSWLTVTSGASGTGNATVGFSAAANTTASPISGTLTIAGNTFTVTEAAQPCTYTLSSTSQSEPAAGGTGSVGVTALAGCAWTASSNNTTWLSVTSGTPGSGNGTVGFSATANSSTSTRSGTLTIAGTTFTVTEPPAGSCATLSSTSQSIPAGGGTGSVSVTAPAGCTWTASSNNIGWLSVTSGTPGSGNGTVGFSAIANTSTSARSGTLTIGGNTFTVTEAAACTYTLSSTSQSETAAGGTGSVGVTTAAGCAWTATSNNTSWLTVTSGSSGSGNGTVAFSAAANTTTSPLSGTLTIAGKTFTVTEAAQSCTYTLGSTSQSEPAAGGTGSVGVTALAGCAWTATSNNIAWLSVTSGTSGSGNGTVGFSAAANTTTSARSGTLTIGGNTFTVNEAAQSCTYTLASTSQAEPAAGGTGSVGVTAPAGCAWTASSNNASWLTVTSGASGTGNGTVGFSAAANTTTSPLSGTLTIGGNTFTVTEAAQSCTYTLSTTTQSEPAAGGTGSVGVTAPAGCAWTASSNNASWLTVTSGASGTGNGTVGFSAAANTTTSPISGTLTIGGNTFTVTEAAQGCTYTLASTSQSEPAAGGTGSVGVTAPAGCAWTATSNNASWLTVTSGSSGSGNGTVGFSAMANTSTSPLSGTLTIGGNTFTVTEAAQSCTYTLSTTSQSEPAAGGTGSVGVTTAAGCAWTASSNNIGWLIVTSGTPGSGNGTVGFSVTANTSTSARSGTLTVGGNTFTVNEAAQGCTYTLSTTTQSEPTAGGTGSVAVTTQAGCAWTASSSDTSWLTVTSGAAGSGNGTVAFSAAANTSGPRTATLTIAGSPVSVTQTGLSPVAPSNVRIIR